MSRTFYLALLVDISCQIHILQLEILHDQYRAYSFEKKSDFDVSVTLRSLYYLFSIVWEWQCSRRRRADTLYSLFGTYDGTLPVTAWYRFFSNYQSGVPKRVLSA
jgi:hypothetical protein